MRRGFLELFMNKEGDRHRCEFDSMQEKEEGFLLVVSFVLLMQLGITKKRTKNSDN